MSLDRQLAETLVRERMLAPGDAVLAAVSGGPDSVALLHLLHDLGPSLGLRLEVAHVEHGVRGRAGREDGEFVRTLAAGLSLPFHLRRLEWPQHGRERQAGNFEALAREGRYRALAEVAAARRIHRVAVGHNRGDQVETMLMWLLRGCGPEGLAGMPAARPLARDPAGAEGALLIRPLLAVSRDEILEYLASRGLEYRQDRTNRDTRYLRNWIRGSVLPGLRQRTGGGLERRLARLAGMLRSDQALLERQVAAAYARVSRADVLDREAFLGLEPALRPRLVRFWLRRVLGTLRRIGYRHVDAVLQLAAGAAPHARASLPGSWTVVREYDAMRLAPPAAGARTEAAGPDGYSYPLPLEGAVDIPEAGVRVTCWRSAGGELPASRFEAAFGLDFVQRAEGALRVRNFRPGDRFRPLGMTGRKKLKDLFIEQKVPRGRRRTVPLLLAREEILWIPGCARSGLARLESGARAAWRVRVSERPPVDSGRRGSY